jgi:hypothetical protein
MDVLGHVVRDHRRQSVAETQKLFEGGEYTRISICTG